MNRFVTLKRDNALFGKYMNGELENGYRAILCDTFSRFNKDKVTFEIFHKSDIRRPSTFRILFDLLRVDTLPLVLAPILVYASLSFGLGTQFSMTELLLLLVSVVSFHASVFLSNDYEDYKNGVDALDESSGSKIIKKGWLTAQSVNVWSYLYLALGAGIGIYLLKDDPVHIATSIVAVFLAYIGYSKGSKSLKSIGLGEFTAFICLGPLLALAMAAKLNSGLENNLLFLSVIFGGFGALYVGSRQLENIMADQKANIRTLSVRMGFEKAKTILGLNFVFVSLLISSFSFMYFHWLKALCIVAVVAPLVFTLVKRIWSINSPLASQLQGLYKKVIFYEVIVTLLIMALYLVKI